MHHKVCQVLKVFDIALPFEKKDGINDNSVKKITFVVFTIIQQTYSCYKFYE
jgi:hypothetical protein